MCELSIIKIKGLAANSLLWRSSDNLRSTRGSPHKKGFSNRAYVASFKNKSSDYLLHKILFPRVPNLQWDFTIHNLNRYDRIRILVRKVKMQTSSGDVLHKTSNWPFPWCRFSCTENRKTSGKKEKYSLKALIERAEITNCFFSFFLTSSLPSSMSLQVSIVNEDDSNRKRNVFNENRRAARAVNIVLTN